jgi:alpha-L-rhamnosidase
MESCLRAQVNSPMASLPASISASRIEPSKLHCEYRVNPLGIDTPQPRFNWVLQAINPSYRGLKQRAYRILVASSLNLLNKGQGDLWDSGRVESDQSIQLAYAGKPLTSEEACYWKVQVWDQNGNPSRWSESNFWSMGLLDTNDWKAQWIGRDDAKPQVPNDGAKVYLPATYLRKEFTVAKPVARAMLYVTGQGVVEPWLNGAKVGEDYFTPGWTDYHKHLYYRTYDVTSLVKMGKNALGAILGDGWFRGNLSIIGQNHYGTKTRLFSQLHLVYADGSSEVVASDSSWKAAFGPILQSDIQAGETYDARLEMPDWSKAGFDASAWQGVVVGSEISPTLLAYPEVPVRRVGEIIPKEITQPRPGLFVFNMGQNFAGWARLKINAPTGTKIVMRFGELKSPDGTVYRLNLRSARATDTYICKGSGEETWEPRFTYHGFQYVEVEGLPDSPDTKTLTGIVVHSSVPPAGDFACSDAIINQTRSNMRWSICSNSFDVPTDCPQRDERMGWMDWHEVSRSALDEFDSSTLCTKWMLDIDDAQLGGGMFSQISPDVHHFPWSPCWADSVLLIPWTMYQVYGDTALAAKYYSDMASHLDYYQKNSPQFIAPDAGYGDWLSLEGTPKDLIYTALFGHECQAMSKMAQALGKADDVQKYETLFEQVRTAFQQKFVHSDGTVGSNSEGSYAFALAYDLLTDAQKDTAGNHLADVIHSRGDHISTGMPATFLLLPALTKTGHTDTAYQMLALQTFPSWGYFLHMGATTIWEHWDGLTEAGFNKDAMNSYNHASLGTCTQWFYSTLLGIDALEPGYHKIIIKPEPGGAVTWAKGYYDSLYGRIECSWKKEGSSLALDVTIPVNASALIYLPASDSNKVLENSVQASHRPGISFQGMDHSYAVFSVGSGTYHFAAR